MRLSARFFLILASAVCVAVSSTAQTVNIFFRTLDEQSNLVNVSQVQVDPIPTNGLIPNGLLFPKSSRFNRANTPSLTNGFFTFSNAFKGFIYRATFTGAGIEFSRDVLASTNFPDGATIDAWTNQVPTTDETGDGMAAFSQSQADGRFLIKSGDTGSNMVFVGPLALPVNTNTQIGYVWTVTNAATGTGEYEAETGTGGQTNVDGVVTGFATNNTFSASGSNFIASVATSIAGGSGINAIFGSNIVNGSGGVIQTNGSSTTFVFSQNGTNAIQAIGDARYDPINSALAVQTALDGESAFAASVSNLWFSSSNTLFSGAISDANTSSNLLYFTLGAPLMITNGSSTATIQAVFNSNTNNGVIEFQAGCRFPLTSDILITNGGMILGNQSWLVPALTLTNFTLDTGTNFGKRLIISGLNLDGGIYPASGWNVASYYDSAHLFPNGFIGDVFWTNRSGMRLEVSGGVTLMGCHWQGFSGNGVLVLNTRDLFGYRVTKFTAIRDDWSQNFVGMMFPGSPQETPGYFNADSSQWNAITPHYSLVIGCNATSNQVDVAMDAANCTVESCSFNNDYFGIGMNAMPGSCKVRGNNFNHDIIGGFYTGNGFPEVSGNNFLADGTMFATWGGKNIDFKDNLISDGALTFTNNSSGFIRNNKMFPGDIWGVNITTNYNSGIIVMGNIGTNLNNTDGSILARLYSGDGGALTNLPIASTTQLGGVKVDGTTITAGADGTISAVTGGGGTVTSVGLSAPAEFTVSGSPVTGSGTLGFTRTAGATANYTGQSPTNMANGVFTNTLSIGGAIGGIDATNVLQVNTLGGARKLNLNTNGDAFFGGNVFIGNKLAMTTNDAIPFSSTAPPTTNQYAYFNGDNGITNIGATLNGNGWTNLTGTNITLDTSLLSATSNGTNYTAVLRSGLPGMQTINAGIATNVNLSLIGTNLADVGRSVFIKNFTNAANCNVTFTFTYATNLNVNLVVSNGWGAIYNFWNADTSGTNVLVSDAGRYHH